MGLNRIRSYLKTQDYDGILLRKKNNFSWVTGGKRNHIVQATEIGVADLLICIDEVYLITTKMEESRIINEELNEVGFDFEILSEDWFNDIDQRIIEHGKGKRIVTDTPFYDWENVDSALVPLRSSLSKSEITRYKWLCQVAAKAVEATCKQISPGQTEFEIAGLLSKMVVDQGINVNVALVATDDRIYQYRHPIPTTKPLKKHAMVVLCAEYGGLVANVTRLVHFGPLPEDLEVNSEKVARIDSVMNASTKPGITIGEIVSKGIQQYEREGHPDDWKLLHQGGLTGYSSREFLATPTTRMKVSENQAFAWNPALPGVKSEDTILVNEEGIEYLTHTGGWVYQVIKMGSEEYLRPAILVR
ncbi:Xaa-Pro peptidase family protein [Alkalihalobacillus sp. AL-G]|uniref:M24 family metallopeptidase n=1 Tax=Alkalihalobacillus sp. AL-G TaxID=2926399 RepID=UPI00272DA146|nr:M24 family metallopeptidase [Alkalihalobacillus sp. AL-G]WLD92797.1 M24 family metallopeptidase [Alkalihalobacillus sp. AL-G]